MTRMTSDIEVLQQLLQDGLAQFAIQGLTMVFVTAVLFSYNWKLALITIAIVMPALIVASLWFRAASERAYLRVRDTLAGVIADIAESLSGVRVVASYNRQRNNVVHHRNVLGAYRAANFKTARVTANYSTVSDFIGLMGQVSLLLIGGTMVLHSWHHVARRRPGAEPSPRAHHRPAHGVRPLPGLVLPADPAARPALQHLPAGPGGRHQAARAAGDAADACRRRPTPTSSRRSRARSRFEDVDFGYVPGDLVLRDVNIAIRAGEAVAFVGADRCGQVDDRQARDPLLRPDERAG